MSVNSKVLVLLHSVRNDECFLAVGRNVLVASLTSWFVPSKGCLSKFKVQGLETCGELLFFLGAIWVDDSLFLLLEFECLERRYFEIIGSSAPWFVTLDFLKFLV